MKVSINQAGPGTLRVLAARLRAAIPVAETCEVRIDGEDLAFLLAVAADYADDRATSRERARRRVEAGIGEDDP
jgi:GGDEF domain-containing protein